MHLLSSLCSGFAAAANGHAELYIRDTPTRATWYGSFEGDSPNSTGANITLDAYGAVEAYVNQLVDVVVKDADGVVVRSFTDGYASPNVEVVSPAFTGTPYGGGGSAVDEPTTLQAVLDLWETNAGAPDWKVSIGGTNTTIENAFGATTGLVFNVKSPAYGATGDGVTNDKAAIDAALAAAVAAGGGTVYFPKGTYRITSALVWDYRVNMLGVGLGLSIISIDAAAEKTVRFTGATALVAPTVIQGMTFQAAQANSAAIFDLEATSRVAFLGCYFGATSNGTGSHIDVNASSSRVLARDCIFNIRGNASPAITFDSGTSGSWVSVESCRLIGPATLNASWLDLERCFRVRVVDCELNGSDNSTTGTNYGIAAGAATSARVVITGNHFYGGAFTAAIRITSACRVHVSDNSFTGVTAVYSIAALLDDNSTLQLEGSLRATSALAAFTIPDGLAQYELVSTGTNPTFTMPMEYVDGQRLTVFVTNDSGGNWANVLFTGASSLFATRAVLSTQTAYMEFVATNIFGAGTEWLLVDFLAA